MMNSYRPNRGGEKSRRRLFFATLLVIVLFLLDVVSGGRLRAATREAGSWIYERGAGIGRALAGSGFFSSRASLAAQNELLQREVADLQQKLAADSALQQENQQLQKFVRVAQKSQGFTAPVVSAIDTSPYGTFIIGAGSSEGLRKGELVLTEDGFVAGTIVDTGMHTALVSEVFAPNASVDAVIGSTRAELKGKGGANAAAEVPRAAAVFVGSVAIAPSLGARPVGIVESVASSSASASQTVLLRLPANLSALEYVYVVAD